MPLKYCIYIHKYTYTYVLIEEADQSCRSKHKKQLWPFLH